MKNGISPHNSELILASTSPRRRQLLADAGYLFSVIPPTADAESEISVRAKDWSPEEFVLRCAFAKGESVVRQIAKTTSARRRVVVACDTIAVCAGERLGKPTDRADAERMLRRLSGSVHEVLSGLAVWSERSPQSFSLVAEEVARTELIMEPLSDAKIVPYLDSGAWCGKAGAFGYQDGNDWLRIRTGSESNVVGLPMERLHEIAASEGCRRMV